MIDTATSTRFLVMHALKVKGVASETALSHATGLPEDTILAEVDQLLAAELVRRRKGRLGGLALVEAGKAVHAELLTVDVDEAASSDLDEAYQAFLPLNGRFKDLCTRWQMRGSEPNEHTDPEYDAGVVAELVSLHGEAQTFLAAAEGALARFGRYPTRLGAALDRVQSGEVAAFTKPLTESYHDVWMELHQDLITSLGRTRNAADEG